MRSLRPGTSPLDARQLSAPPTRPPAAKAPTSSPAGASSAGQDQSAVRANAMAGYEDVALAEATPPSGPLLPGAGAPRSEWEKYLTALAPGVKIVDGDKKWQASELEAIARQASKLSPRDAALLRNVSLVRDAALTDSQGKPTAELADTVVAADGKATMTFGDLAGDDKFGFAPTFVHELGHVAMGDGTYSPTRIREFGKLSQFQETRSGFGVFAGVNWRGHSVDFSNDVIPGRTDNFASPYAAKSPFEDYAESYRTYYDDPVKLLQRAPEKFLYINADSGKYSASEVGGLLARAGLDGTAVATDMVRDGWQTGESLERILGTSGLAADPAALARTHDAVRGVFSLLLGKGAEADAFRQAFESDPVGTLQTRGLWDDLSKDVRDSIAKAKPAAISGMMHDPELEKLIASQPNPKVQAFIDSGSIRSASYLFVPLRPGGSDWVGDRFKKIATRGVAYKTDHDDWGALHLATARMAQAIETGTPPDFMAKFQQDPAMALGPAIWSKLDATMKATLQDPAFQETAVRRLTSGVAGEEALAADAEQAIYTRGVRDLMTDLLRPNSELRKAITQGKGWVAEKLLYERDDNGECLADRLPSSLRNLLVDDSGLRSTELQAMLNNPKLKEMMTVLATQPDSAAGKNARKLLDNLTVTDTLAFVRSLNALVPSEAKAFIDNPDRSGDINDVLAPESKRWKHGNQLGERLADALKGGSLLFAGAGPAM